MSERRRDHLRLVSPGERAEQPQTVEHVKGVGLAVHTAAAALVSGESTSVVIPALHRRKWGMRRTVDDAYHGNQVGVFESVYLDHCGTGHGIYTTLAAEPLLLPAERTLTAIGGRRFEAHTLAFSGLELGCRRKAPVAAQYVVEDYALPPGSHHLQAITDVYEDYMTVVDGGPWPIRRRTHAIKPGDTVLFYAGVGSGVRSTFTMNVPGFADVEGVGVLSYRSTFKVD